MQLTSAQFQRMAAIAGELWGLDLTPRQHGMVEERIGRLLSGRTAADVDAYITFIEQEASEADRLELFDTLSNKVTGFFRDRTAFDDLQREFYTPLSRGNTTTPQRTICIWSAGCSIGAEAYSLAIQIWECLPDLHKWDIDIIASDLSPTALSQTRVGAYPAEMLASVDPALVERHFIRDRQGWLHVRPHLKRLVCVERKNLAAQPVLNTSCDVIVCCDVLRSMTQRAREVLTKSLTKSLRTGGLLVVGRDEAPADSGRTLRQVRPCMFVKQAAVPSHATASAPAA